MLGHLKDAAYKNIKIIIIFEAFLRLSASKRNFACILNYFFNKPVTSVSNIISS